MEVDGIIAKVASLTVQERLNLARNTYADLMARLSEKYGDEEAVKIFITFVKVFVSADKVTTDAEYALFKLITECNWSFSDFYEMTNGGSDPELVDAVDRFIDSLDEDGKIASVVMAMSFMTIDGEITESERQTLQKFYE